MQTRLPEDFTATPQGARADEILRNCVHCGFCNATCPTYLLQGDELDGPRGRIYLIKEMLETEQSSKVVQTHLDRCLTCRACETTCPSGVAYGELLEIGRNVLEQRQPRSLFQRLQRLWLKRVVPTPRRFRRWLRLARLFQLFLPARVVSILPRSGREQRTAIPVIAGGRQIVLMDGCVQRVSTPEVNDSLIRLLAGRDIQARRVEQEGCCGALALHLGDESAAHAAMRANLDALAPVINEVEAIISTASGCGVTLKDYGRLLGTDPAYRDLAKKVAGKVLDASEFLASEQGFVKATDYHRIAWQAPCTLQHGQRLSGQVERLLQQAGYDLVPVANPHLCCGSAGTYSLLQPEMATTLGQQKLATLTAHQPDAIATANVGCHNQLIKDSPVPVLHWLELIGNKP